MPEPTVREDIGKGRLVRLDMPELKHGSVRFYAIHRTDTPPGPAGSALIARFVGQAAEDEEAGARSPPSMSGKRRRVSR